MSDQLEKRRQQFDTWLENLEMQRRTAPSASS
jgi:hypothetical protein